MAVIIDNGTGMTKAGFEAEESPKCCFPAIVGYANKTGSVKMTSKDDGNDAEYYVGEKAMAKRAILDLHKPIEHGRIKDDGNGWTDMERIWQHVYEEKLLVKAEDQGVLLTEAPKNPKKTRERMTQIFFENFNVPQYYVAMQAILALYSSGRVTGCVVDSGDGVTHTVPVYEGYSLPHAVRRIDFAGRDLSFFMREQLQEHTNLTQFLNIQSQATMEIVRDIKERLSYVALDYDKELKEFDDGAKTAEKYALPDGNVITVGKPMFTCPEAFFQPQQLTGKEIPSMPQLAYDTIQACDIDVRRDLFENMIMSGGSTMFQGIPDRLEKEVIAKAPPKVKVKINAPAERKYSVWIGGAILTHLTTFANMWITKEDYEEHGVSIVHRKCF